MIERPKRAYSLTIELGADDKETLVASLKEIVFKISKNGLESNLGGHSVGYHFRVDVDETMTNEKYFELLHQYLEEKEK